MHKNAKVYVAGHTGLVGSALVRTLRSKGYENLLLRSSRELNLIDQQAVADFFQAEKPQYVFLAAAKVGGIVANNTYPADFIYDNLLIEANIIHQSYLTGVDRLLFLGSTCIYPKRAPQPMREEHLLTGPLEPTNEPYAVAKIAGITLCRSYNRQHGTRFLAAMPTNLYGPNDNFDLQTSHVLPALIRKFHEAKVTGADPVTIWGTGSPYREFLHADDLAEGVVHLMNLPDETFCSLLADPVAPALVNVGSGEEVSIRDLALLVKETVGFTGELCFDTSKPDGTPRKLSGVSRIQALGWQRRIGLKEGLASAYRWFLESQRSL